MDRIEAEAVAGAELALALAPLVGAEDAVGRIGEPDAAIRLDDDIVGRVEPLAAVVVGEHGDAAVRLGAGDAARAVLAGDEAALAVARIAVAVVRGLPEDAHAGTLDELHDAVVRDVAPQESIAVGEIDRPFGPQHAAMQLLEPGIAQRHGAKALVEDLGL